MDEYMSAYRTGVSNSCTERSYSTINKRIAAMVDKINQYTLDKFEEVINRTKY